jgi:hypothetical protein
MYPFEKVLGWCCCVQVRDFGLVFDALTHFEESLLAAKMAAAGDEEPDQEVSKANNWAVALRCIVVMLR